MSVSATISRHGLDKPSNTLPLLIAFGLGLYWCWRSSVYSLDPGLGWMTRESSAMELNSACLGGVVAALALIASGAKPLAPETVRMRSLSFAAFCSVATAAVYFLKRDGSAGELPLILMQCLAFGFGLALVVQWGVASVSVSPRNLSLGLAGSIAVGSVGYLLVRALPSTLLADAVICLLPMASGCLAVHAQRQARDDAPQHELPRGAIAKEAWPCVVVLVVLISFVGAEEMLRVAFTQPMPATDQLPALFTHATQIGALFCALVLILVILVSKKTPTFDATTRALVPLMVVGFLSLLIAGPKTPWLSYVILGIGYWCLRFLIWRTAAAVTRKTDVAAQVAFAAVEGAICLMVLLAQILVPPQSLDSSSQLAAVSAAVLTAVLGAMVLLNARFLGTLESVQAQIPHAAEAASASNRKSLDEAVRELGEEFRLTPREREVLTLLARGRSLPYVQEELGIAVGTAQAHARHIYDKLDVHNRQQLIDLVENARTAGTGQ